MLIKEFSTASGLPVDTIRFYIRKGLIKPEVGAKGGSNPYQIFTKEHVQAAKIIRVSQALGFPLKGIAGTIAEYMSGEMSPEQSVGIVREQLAKMERKARELQEVVLYMRAKLAWMEAGAEGEGPDFDDFISTAGPGLGCEVPTSFQGEKKNDASSEQQIRREVA